MNNDQALNLLSTYLETKNHEDLLKFRQINTEIIPTWHVNMLNDAPRNTFYQKEIKSKVKDKIVMDVGCGSGLLTYFALEAGAKHVYAIEKDPILQTCFAHAFKNEIAEGRVSLFKDISKYIEKKDFKYGEVEVVIHEIFSNDLFSENVLECFDDLYERKIIHNKMIFIPQKFRLLACLHCAQEYPYMDELYDIKLKEKFWFLESIISSAEHLRYLKFENKSGQDVSEPFEVFNFDLANLRLKHSSEHQVKALSSGNYVRTWFELIGDHSNLTTDIRTASETHWDNPIYRTSFQKGHVNVLTTYHDFNFKIIVKSL